METRHPLHARRRMPVRERAHAVAFDQPERAVAAARALRHAGFHVVDAHTPFAVHGMDDALGLQDTRVGWVALAGGALGAAIGFLFPIWTHAVSWPMNIGGKDPVAWQAIIPVAFEVTVLLAAFGALIGLFASSRLHPRLSGRPRSQPTDRVTDDRFLLIVAETDGAFSIDTFREHCRTAGAIDVVEGWEVS